MNWQLIETAPEGEIVFVGWLDGEGEECYEIDYKEDGCWHKHEELVQYASAVAPRDMDIPCKMPSVEAPYTHWLPRMPLPEPPEAQK